VGGGGTGVALEDASGVNWGVEVGGAVGVLKIVGVASAMGLGATVGVFCSVGADDGGCRRHWESK
jgi:hypothetical protein